MPDVQTESKKRLIPVLNNRLGNVQIQCGSGAKGVFDGSKLLLLVAGSNLVPETKWSEAKKQSSVKRLLRCKIRGTGSPEDADARVGEPILVEGKALNAENPLMDYPEDEALRFVERTESLAILKDLSKREAPKKVLEAIDVKLHAIEDQKNELEKKRT